MADVNLIADEVHFQGYLVAVLAATGVPASVMAEFESGMSNATLFEGCGSPTECPDCEAKFTVKHADHCPQYKAEDSANPTDYERGLQDLKMTIRAASKGGLFNIEQLDKLIEQLKEDEENDQ